MSQLLKAKGIIKENEQIINILQPKMCPHCKEPNKPDAQFCFKCNFVMSFEAYHKGMEEKEKKNQEILELKERMDKMTSEMRFFRNEFMAYVKQYGHRRLTDEERKKVDPMFLGVEVMHTINDQT